MAKELFGTDGIRGVPGTYPLDDDTLYAAGRALGDYLRRAEDSPHVLIGMDTRESDPHISSLMANGLSHAGGPPPLAGVFTTPGALCLVLSNKLQACVFLRS